MLWRILPHATACITSDKLVLLDLRQDRYFQATPKTAEAMRAWLDLRHHCKPPDEVEAMLLRTRVLRKNDTHPTNVLRERVQVPDAIGPLAEAGDPKERPMRVGTGVAMTWLRLRSSPLYRILSARAARAPLTIPRDPSEILARTAEFERSRPVAPFARNCLLDSLALDAWLARHELGSQLVFGVTAEPFTAHCWLQTPGMILNDSFDHASRFTPIFVQ